MPVEFLTDDEAAAYGRYAGAPSQADMERVFFLDDEDRKLVDLRRGDHMKAGFALQLVTVRWLGTFLEDPLDVPGEVLDFVAGQLGIANPAVAKRYTDRLDPQEVVLAHPRIVSWGCVIRPAVCNNPWNTIRPVRHTGEGLFHRPSPVKHVTGARGRR